ncbi:hypothetical protein EON65_51585 [archaeon]|nr:MAG: hypothetical protein EON65_51585 [archaeon]
MFACLSSQATIDKMEVIIAKLLSSVKHLTPAQRWGIVLTCVLVLVSVFVYNYSNQAEEMGQKSKDLLDHYDSSSSTSLMNPADIKDGTIGQTDKYEWSQGDSEMEVFVNLTPYTSQNRLRGRDITVDIKPKSIQVKILNNVVIEGDLEGVVMVDDSTWVIDEIASSIVTAVKTPEDPTQLARGYVNPENIKSTQQVLWITLMKAPNSETIWAGLIKGEKCI